MADNSDPIGSTLVFYSDRWTFTPGWGGLVPETLKIVLLMFARIEIGSKYQVAHLSQSVTEEAIVTDRGREPINNSAGWTSCFHG
jgi:hypothetical protein